MHPKNKNQRKMIGFKKGIKRSKALNPYRIESTKYFDKNKEVSYKEFIEAQARHLRNTAKLCSCSMCGNPRRNLKEKTLQEVKNEKQFQFELQDLKNAA